MTNISDFKSHRFCVIMCGGIGSRFWPYSRTDRPKQFIDFFGTGRSLLQMTYDRLLPLVPKENIYVVTNEMYAELVREQLPDIIDANMLLEPTRRNTAPCVAWASWHIHTLDPEAAIVFTPSDHMITRERDFETAILNGFDFVEKNNALLTLGIKPTRPETGYGYIQVGDKFDGPISKVKTFTEKPNREFAEMFISTGEFFWNSGIFMWRTSAILQAFNDYAPEIASIFADGTTAYGTDKEKDFINRAFPACQAISIDYAVMEKATNVYVQTVTFGWNDLGTWGALYDMSPKNRDANVASSCRSLSYNATGNIYAVYGEKLLVVKDLKDYIIADSDDVLLICPKADEQAIKDMVKDAKVKFGDKYL
jgi:mannose-1-phosphate guanylyltransferase